MFQVFFLLWALFSPFKLLGSLSKDLSNQHRDMLENYSQLALIMICPLRDFLLSKLSKKMLSTRTKLKKSNSEKMNHIIEWKTEWDQTLTTTYLMNKIIKFVCLTVTLVWFQVFWLSLVADINLTFHEYSYIMVIFFRHNCIYNGCKTNIPDL